MITKLTKDQEARFPEFIEKWTNIGLSTAPLNRVAIERAIATAYGEVKKPSPRLVTCSSPLATALVRSVLASVLDSVGASVGASVRDSVRASVRASVGASVGASVRASVRASVLDSVLASVRDSVLDSVLASVRASVRDSVGDSVRDSVRASVRASVLDSVLDSVSDSVSDSVRASVLDSVRWYGFGQYEAWWLSWYDYVHTALEQDTSRLSGLESICREAGWSLMFWDFALVSEKPTAIHRNEHGQLHRDGAAALLHSDGWGVYALNGVRMKEDYVLTPSKDIKPETVLKEPNADVRRELIRKVGIERMLCKLPHKRLDKSGNYELLSVNLGGKASDARYLKMINPSIGVFHLEGVGPDINTVEQSLNWRNSQWHTNAEILT